MASSPRTNETQILCCQQYGAYSNSKRRLLESELDELKKAKYKMNTMTPSMTKMKKHSIS